MTQVIDENIKNEEQKLNDQNYISITKIISTIKNVIKNLIPNVLDKGQTQSNFNTFNLFTGKYQIINQYVLFFSSKTIIHFVEIQWNIYINRTSFFLKLNYQTLKILGNTFNIKNYESFLQASKYINYLNQNIAFSNLKYFINNSGSIWMQSKQMPISKKYFYNQIYNQAKIAIQNILFNLPIFLNFIPQLQNHIIMLTKSINNYQKQEINSIEKSQVIREFIDQRQQKRYNQFKQNNNLEHNNFIQRNCVSFQKQKQAKNTMNFISPTFERNKKNLFSTFKQKIQQNCSQQNFSNSCNSQKDKKQDLAKNLKQTIIQGIQIMKRPQNYQNLKSGNFAQIKVGIFQFQVHSTQNIKVNKQISNFSLIEYKKSYLAQKQAKKQHPYQLLSLNNEISIISFIRGEHCSHIAQYYIDVQNKNKLYMPLYQGSLAQLLKKYKDNRIFLKIETKLLILKGVVLGIQFLQSRKIVHRDLKPANILMSKNLTPKIIDFGSSSLAYQQKNKNSKHMILCSTPGYYIEYDNISQRLKNCYLRQQYQQHKNFDIYSLKKLTQRIFFKQFQQNTNLIVNELKFLITNFSHQIPESRIQPTQILLYLQNLLQKYSYKIIGS